MQFFNKIILSASDMSSDVTSDAMQLEQYLGYAIGITITGSPVGILLLQGSCDPPQTPMGVQPSPSTFIDIGGTSNSITTATTVLYNMYPVQYNWVRIKYTRTSGSGAITATFNAKGY